MVIVCGDNVVKPTPEEQVLQEARERHAREFQHWLDWVQGRRPDPPESPF